MVGMKTQQDGELLPMFGTKLRHNPIVLRIPWLLRLHDVVVHFVSDTVALGSEYCIAHCHDARVSVEGVTGEPPEPVSQVKDIFELHIRPPRLFRVNIMMLNVAWF
jgi:hypothetical protein